jgi:lipopolysaccharide transport system ATP-binding protein
MSDPIIRVNNLSKKYILSHQQEGTYSYKALRDVITTGAKSLVKNLMKSSASREPDPMKEEFWALKGISFEVNQGEAVGIIGRNGAGKSTLLKLLSRITEPTTGNIKIAGRVASLLEVGTGFHPELTGRENISLNGAILGMGRVEIKRKFDEIVSFAEVEKFLDTPVKRYSSGMYVRLAFSVAAHLEPEILIVDEVLAVGDSAFQKKCLGKMGDVASKEGRTVLFVSHSMQAIAQLTKRCILLSKGEIQFNGRTDKAMGLYLTGVRDLEEPAYYESPLHKYGNHIAWARVHTSEENGVHCWGEAITVEFALEITEPHKSLRFSFQVVNFLQQPIIMFYFFEADQAPFCEQKGIFIVRCEIPKFRLYMGSYTLTTWLGESHGKILTENLREICPFEISMHNSERADYPWASDECTYLEDARWKVIKS